ncbi:MAG: hypothetical protein KF791_04845 [Verrucomicrobiae bacterium]|nr:hypothetical protein [Verrucomicrobiae bacterium]
MLADRGAIATPTRQEHEEDQKTNHAGTTPGTKPVGSKRYREIKLGLDVHVETIVVVGILENSSPQPAQKFTPEKFVAWVKNQMDLAEEVHSCYEAGPFGYVLHRQLVAWGIRVRT